MKLPFEPVWLEIDHVLELHARAIEGYGGSAGMRDRALLETALARPQTLFSYTPESTLSRLAASYIFGVVKFHHFIDGIKL